MQLEIPKDVEASIHSKAIASGFQTVEEYILDRLEIDDPVVNTPDLKNLILDGPSLEDVDLERDSAPSRELDL